MRGKRVGVHVARVAKVAAIWTEPLGRREKRDTMTIIAQCERFTYRNRDGERYTTEVPESEDDCRPPTVSPFCYHRQVAARKSVPGERRGN